MNRKEKKGKKAVESEHDSKPDAQTAKRCSSAKNAPAQERPKSKMDNDPRSLRSRIQQANMSIHLFNCVFPI